MLNFFKAEAITNDQKHVIKYFTLLAIKKYQLKWYLTVFLHIRTTKMVANDNTGVSKEQGKQPLLNTAVECLHRDWGKKHQNVDGAR